MAKDPSKKGVRKIPPEFLKWIEVYYGPEMVKWYKLTTGKGKAEASKQRQDMSDLVNQTGAFHEGHYQGAKDFDPEMGGGPTTGRTMRPEIGVVNVNHAEKARIAKADMKRLGIPQFWIEDFYEAILESENLKVIGNPDVQAGFEMDRGASAEEAAYNSRTRDDLRAQGENIPGSRYTATDKPAPITQLPESQPRAPRFDASSIKTGTGIPRVTGESRAAVPRLQVDKGSIRLRGLRRATGLIPLAPAAIGAIQTGAQAAQGDFEGAKLTAAETVVGEVPVVGDLAIADPVAAGTLEAAERDKARAAAPKTAVAKFLDDPMNELEWLGKQLTSFGGGIRLGW